IGSDHDPRVRPRVEPSCRRSHLTKPHGNTPGRGPPALHMQEDPAALSSVRRHTRPPFAGSWIPIDRTGQVVADHHRKPVGTPIVGEPLGPLTVVTPARLTPPPALQDVVGPGIPWVVRPVGRTRDAVVRKPHRGPGAATEGARQAEDPSRCGAGVLQTLSGGYLPVDPEPRPCGASDPLPPRG